MEYHTKIKQICLSAGLLCCFGVLVYNTSVWSVLTCVIGISMLYWMCGSQSKSYSIVNKAVFVTGCDTGIGHDLALSLSRHGAVVFAGCLNKESDGGKILKEKTPDSNMHVLQIDVQNMEDIIQARDYIQSHIGQEGLWGVVNNAAHQIPGDIELQTMEQIERVNNINYLGLVRVTKTFIPIIRKSTGRIVNVSSARGLVSEPYNSAYTASKYAVEAFSDTLRLEMEKFGVKVSIIEPCNFSAVTKLVEGPRAKADLEVMWKELSVEQKDVYGKDYIDCQANDCSSQNDAPCLGLSTDPVVRAMEHALFNENPKTRYLVVPGTSCCDYYKWSIFVKPFVPDWIFDKWILQNNSRYPLKGE